MAANPKSGTPGQQKSSIPNAMTHFRLAHIIKA
jgi:hypothetical protein